MGYGSSPLGTDSGSSKMYGLAGTMGYGRYGLRETRLYMEIDHSWQCHDKYTRAPRFWRSSLALDGAMGA